MIRNEKQHSVVRRLLALTLAGLASACSQDKPPQPEVAPSNKQELTRDSLYMARLYEKWSQGPGRVGEIMPIDFADSVQYRFLENRLRATGNTQETSPHLFAELAKKRTQALAARKDGLATQTAALESEGWCGHIVTHNEGLVGGTARFTQTGIITCGDGSEYSYIDVNAYATNRAHTEFTLLANNYNEDYYQKIVESPPLNADIPVGPDREIFVDSMSMAFDDTRGLSFSGYVQVMNFVPDRVSKTTIEHPVERIGSGTDNPIRTCLERGAVYGSLDCDYASVGINPNGTIAPFQGPYKGIAAVDAPASMATTAWTPKEYWPASTGYDIDRLYLPLKGSFDPGAANGGDCQITSTEGSKAVIIRLEQGGTCIVQGMNDPVGTATLPWLPAGADNIRRFNGLGDFGKDCLGYLQNVRLMFTIKTRATCGTVQDVPRAGTVNNLVLDFKNSCLAEGTRILRADGKSATIESIKVGDKVLADGVGRALTVTSISMGSESQKMVRLHDARGREVLVTSKHPFISETGAILAAEALQVGDTVRAQEGLTRLTSIERVDYKGQVYNLTLGSEQELAKLARNEHTMIANGFVVGDNQMQTDLERESTRKENTLATLPAAWHVDYRNDLMRKKSSSPRQ